MRIHNLVLFFDAESDAFVTMLSYASEVIFLTYYSELILKDVGNISLDA